MPFWKKHEDPWDIDPEKKRKTLVFAPEPDEAGESESLLSELKDLFKKKEEPVEEPPACPWCGQAMARGYLMGGQGCLSLLDKKPTAVLGALGYDAVTLRDEGFMTNYKSCWQCKSCRKVVADIPEPETVPDDAREGGAARPLKEEMTEQE